MIRSMADSLETEHRRNAVHAYEHASEAGHRPVHRVDVVDEPQLNYGAPRQRPTVISRPPVAPLSPLIEHRFADPAATAFKAGFGFAAGTGLFRLVATAGGLLLLVLVTTIALAALGA